MLLLTRRPMVFLLGIGSVRRTAASVLRPCRGGFGRGRDDLEANPENSSCPSPDGSGSRVRRDGVRGTNGTRVGVSAARGRRSGGAGRDGGRVGGGVRWTPLRSR